MTEKTPNNAVHSLQDLELYGLNCLTGEACAFSMRLLFDVNEHGARQLAHFFGVVRLEFNPNWNGYVNGEEAIGSIMLSADVAWEFAAFMLLVDKFDIVIPSQEGRHGVYGFMLDDDAAYEYRDSLREKGIHLLRNTTQGADRNTHQFTGRTA